MPRFCTAGLLSIPDYNTSLLCSQPSPLPRTRSSTLASTFNTCMLTQTDSSDVIEFTSVSPSASLSLSLYRAYKCVYPCCCQLGSAYFTQSPLISFYFISDIFCTSAWCSSPIVPLSLSLPPSLTHTACIKVCQNIANHWPDVKPLSDLFVAKHIMGKEKNTKNPSKFFVLGKRKGWKKVLDFYLYVCKKIKLFFI